MPWRSGWWKNPDSRGTGGCADALMSCAGHLTSTELTSDTAGAFQCRRWALQHAGSAQMLVGNTTNPYFSEACTDFGWCPAGRQAHLCGVLSSGAACGHSLLSQAIHGCSPFPVLQVSPWRLCIVSKQDLSQAEGSHLFSKSVQYTSYLYVKHLKQTNKHNVL